MSQCHSNCDRSKDSTTQGKRCCLNKEIALPKRHCPQPGLPTWRFRMTMRKDAKDSEMKRTNSSCRASCYLSRKLEGTHGIVPDASCLSRQLEAIVRYVPGASRLASSSKLGSSDLTISGAWSMCVSRLNFRMFSPLSIRLCNILAASAGQSAQVARATQAAQAQGSGG